MSEGGALVQGAFTWTMTFATREAMEQAVRYHVEAADALVRPLEGERKGNPCERCKMGTADLTGLSPQCQKPLEDTHIMHGPHPRRRFCIGK